MKTQITNVNIVLRDGIIENGVVAYENGIITYVGKENQQVANTIDGLGGYLMAGFVDIHCHGGIGLEFMGATEDEMKQIAEYYLKNGTTTLVPTTITGPMETIENSIKTFGNLLKKGENRNLTGFHMEGPYFSAAQCGAQDPSDMIIPTIEEIDRLIKEYPYLTRISLAPELENGLEVGKFGSENGLVMAIAHTDADFDTVEKARENGYTLVTHLYSGMSGVHRVNAYRIAGTIEAGLYDDQLYVEMIGDNRHLPVALYKLIIKCKGIDKICLVTDAIKGGGMPEGYKFMIGPHKAVIENSVGFLEDRTAFVGSVATMDRIVRIMVNDVKLSLPEVTVMASEVPAKVMKLTDRGIIKQGKVADLVLLDKDLNVKKVIFKGEVV